MSDPTSPESVDVLIAPSASGTSIFNGVAAGDMTTNDAILWTRATDLAGTSGVSLTAQVSTSSTFAAGVLSYTGATLAVNDFTLKLDATGLASNTTYFYRFVDGSGGTSDTGRFMTTPLANQRVQVRFAFSGDADGRFRPYDSMAGFGTAAQPQSQNLRFFTFLGDTMYETASTGSPVVPTVTSATTGAALATALAAYDRKYLENVSGVTTSTGAASASGQQGLQAMLAATGEYTVLDNHELGNVSLQSGGAPLAAGARVTSAQGFDVNTTGAFDNQTAGFKTLEKAYFDYHPTRFGLDAALNSTGPTVTAPADARSNGTVQQYFVQQQGANAVYIQLDDRSYRDARLGTAAGADDVTSGRQLNPNRTMLGATQLAFFKQSLLAAQAAGTPWKFVSISTPIDQTGPAQDGKSWYGGYTAERNDILKFIADNNIRNVVFLSTDDHLTRETALTYQTTFGDASTTRTVPGAFLVVTGPIGAGGPDAVTDHSFSNLTSLLATTNSGLDAAVAPEIGLAAFSGLTNVHRQFDTATAPSSIDFFSPDTFNYTVLDVSADGSSLTVDTYGIPSYQANTFPQTSAAPADIMGFTLAAGFTAATPACYCPGTLILTESGEVAIEALSIGDRLITVSGESRAIRWIGRRSYAGRFLEGQPHLLPIRIAAGALADGVPRRDLLVSPLHAMLLDGALIPASALVNGASIVQVETADTVSYIHLELETHDVIMAEGAASETFVDDDSRNIFHNVADYRARYPEAVRTPAQYCAPRVEDGEALEAVRCRLAVRAGLIAAAEALGTLVGVVDVVSRGLVQGWARDAARPERKVVLQVLDNGAVIGEVVADRARPDVALAGLGDGMCGFELVIPGGLCPDARHEIRVRRVDGQSPRNGVWVLEAELPARAAPAAAGDGLRGFLDGATRDRIHGWAIDADADAPVALQILDNGLPIARVLANGHRTDLVEAGIGRGWHAFDVAIPGGLSPASRHVIQVRRESDGAEIEGSPVVLEAAGRFDAAFRAAVAQAVVALDDNAERAQAHAFLAEQAEMVLQQRAAAEAKAAERQAQRRSTRRSGAGGALALRALVIDERLPRDGRDAGSQAILSHVRALQSLGYDVSLVAADEMAVDEMAAGNAALEELGIAVCRAPFYASVEEVLRRQAGCFDVVYLHRASIAGRYLALARQYAPRARILYSVADLHHLRMARQAEVESEPELLAMSQRMRRNELMAALSADAVLTHSVSEAALLRQAAPQAQVHHAPWALPVRKAPPAFKARQGLAFIGHYGHAPNVDAALLLVEVVMPLVWQTAPEIECLLVGGAMPERLSRLHGGRVRVLGAVGDLHAEVLDRVRLTAATLRFGAGVKGKVLESFAAGVPCVMTPVGAEGLVLPDLLQGMVSRDAVTLAATICRLHGNAGAHRAAAQAGLAYMRRAHSEAVVAAALKGAIEGRGVEGRMALAG